MSDVEGDDTAPAAPVVAAAPAAASGPMDINSAIQVRVLSLVYGLLLWAVIRIRNY
jgi:hypothetical protein